MTRRRSPVRRSGRLAAVLGKLATISVISLLLALGDSWLTRRAGGTSGSDHAQGSVLLARLADASGLTPLAAGPATHVRADGTTADATTRDYRIRAAPARVGLLRACAANGLSAPTAEDRRLTPDMLCQGRWRDRSVTVHLNGRCDPSCVVTLETRVS